MGQTGVVDGGRLTDWTSLGVLASWGTDGRDRGDGEGRAAQGRKLPPRVVAYLVMALALFTDEDYEEVAARLAETFADWDGWEEYWGGAPTSGAVTPSPAAAGT